MTPERILRGDPFHAPKIARRDYLLTVNGSEFYYATFDAALRAANIARGTWPPKCVLLVNVDKCEGSFDDGQWNFDDGLTKEERDRFEDLTPTLEASIDHVREERMCRDCGGSLSVSCSCTDGAR